MGNTGPITEDAAATIIGLMVREISRLTAELEASKRAASGMAGQLTAVDHFALRIEGALNRSERALVDTAASKHNDHAAEVFGASEEAAAIASTLRSCIDTVTGLRSHKKTKDRYRAGWDAGVESAIAALDGRVAR